MIFNVKASPYNAYGDETHDDLAAIQAAINAAASAGGGIVFFPPGNYKINSVWVDLEPPGDPGPRGIELKSGVVMRGSGTQNTRIFQEPLWDWNNDPDPPSAPPNQNWCVLFTQPAPGTRVSEVGIQDLTIDGGYTPNSKSEPEDFQHYHGIDLRSASRVSILNTRIVQCAGDGIRINGRAISMSDPRPLSSTEILIENCSFDTIWRIGISLGRDYRNITVRGCTFRNWENFIVKAEFDTSTVSDDPTLCRGLTVRDCVCLEPSPGTGTTSPASISVLGSPHQILRNTLISENVLRGYLHLGFTQHVKIEGNTLFNPTPYGANINNQDSIQLRGDVEDALIQGNHLRMTQSGGIGLRGLHASPGLNRRITLAYNTIEWVGEDTPKDPVGRGIDVVHAEESRGPAPPMSASGPERTTRATRATPASPTPHAAPSSSTATAAPSGSGTTAAASTPGSSCDLKLSSLERPQGLPLCETVHGSLRQHAVCAREQRLGGQMIPCETDHAPLSPPPASPARPRLRPRRL